MGFSPVAVRRMSLWDFHMASDGFIKANSVDEGELTSKEQNELGSLLDQWHTRRGLN